MSLPTILAKLLKQQAELADMLANSQEIDGMRRNKLRDESLLNAANFSRFVSQYKITVEKRPNAPKPPGVCSQCLK